MNAAEVLAFEDGPFTAPHTYKLGPGEAFKPASIFAIFDGAAAGADFLPCCSFYSQDGKLLARVFPGKVTAGDVSEVTFSPFSLAPTSGADGLTGIFYGIENHGEFLHVHADTGNPGDRNIILATDFGYVEIDSGIDRTDPGQIELHTQAGNLNLIATDGIVTLDAGGNIFLSVSGFHDGQTIHLKAPHIILESADIHATTLVQTP